MTATIIDGNFEYHLPTAPATAPEPVFIKTFDNRRNKDGTCVDFSALNDAEAYLTARGFSFGPGCAASRKAGVLYGPNWQIAKWRNLTPLEQRQCHGVIEGERRTGPITLRIFFHAPAFAIAAVASPEHAGAIVDAWATQR